MEKNKIKFGTKYMSTAVKLPQEEVTPEEIAAIEKVLQHIDRENARKSIFNFLVPVSAYRSFTI